MTYIYIYDEVIKTEINSDDQILWKNIQSVHLFERANNIYLDEQNKKLKYLMINKNSISWEIKTQNQSKCNWTTTEVDHGQTQPHTQHSHTQRHVQRTVDCAHAHMDRTFHILYNYTTSITCRWICCAIAVWCAVDWGYCCTNGIGRASGRCRRQTAWIACPLTAVYSGPCLCRTN